MVAEEHTTQQNERATDTRPRSGSGPRHRCVVAGLVVLMLLFAACCAASIHGYPSTIGDSVRYFFLGQSLAAGEGYRITYRVPESDEARFPPLLPILLAPVAAAFPHNLPAAKAVPAAFGVLSVLLTFLAFRKRVGAASALAVAALVALNPLVLSFSTVVLAEIPFICLFLLALAAIQRVGQPPRGWIAWRHAWAGLIIALAMLMRVAGVALIPTAFLWLATKKRLRDGIVVAVLAIAFASPWLIWSATRDTPWVGHLGETFRRYRGGGPSIAGELKREGVISPAQMARRVIRNVPELAQSVPSVLLPGGFLLHLDGDCFPFAQAALPDSLARALKRHTALAGAIGLPLLGLALIGFARSLLREWTPMECFVLVYVAMILAYAPIEDRFVAPLIPVLAFYFLRGVQWAAAGLTARPRAATAAVVCVVLVANALLTARLVWLNASLPAAKGPKTGRAELVQCYGHDSWAPVLIAATWVAKHVPADKVVMWSVTDAGPCYYFSRRKICEVPDTPNLDIILAAVSKYGDYVVQQGPAGTVRPEPIDCQSYGFTLVPRQRIEVGRFVAAIFQKQAHAESRR